MPIRGAVDPDIPSTQVAAYVDRSHQYQRVRDNRFHVHHGNDVRDDRHEHWWHHDNGRIILGDRSALTVQRDASTVDAFVYQPVIHRDLPVLQRIRN